MTRLVKGPAALAAVVLLVAPALAAADGRWIHVRVDEDGAHGAKVDVQVPLSMVSALMPTLKAKMDVDGHLDFGSSDVSLDELRSYWKAVKESKDGNYVTVKDGSDTVRIAKRAHDRVVRRQTLAPDAGSDHGRIDQDRPARRERVMSRVERIRGPRELGQYLGHRARMNQARGQRLHLTR